MDGKRKRGELRIYLGAAPGVGKTFAMLGEAHRRRARGTDVVVGLVETHGRENTAALLDGLEQLPRHHPGAPAHRQLDHPGDPARSDLDHPGNPARRPLDHQGDPAGPRLDHPSDRDRRPPDHPAAPARSHLDHAGDPAGPQLNHPGDRARSHLDHPGGLARRQLDHRGDPPREVASVVRDSFSGDHAFRSPENQARTTDFQATEPPSAEQRPSNTELDVDGLLARRPEVAVVDELAHTNAPGSRNAKRWQDVEELLEAGIDVLSTVNVQHLESLNDVVERITGVRQRETVPDEVVRRAEQVELVDLTPEALRRRLAHGNVYAAHKIDAALGNYFRVGNLTALRELALLWVADQVDVALQRYRSEQSITDTWEARERVVVAISGGPESETLIRRARRIAARAGAELMVVHILRGDGLEGVSPQLVAGFRRVTEDVGATFHTVVGDDVPTALLDFARGVNATQLVLGTSRRSRLARVFDEGIGAATIQESGPIDVHMVTHDEARRGPRRRRAAAAHPGYRRLLGWALAGLLPAVVTGIGLLLGENLTFSTNLVGFFLATVVVALVGGHGPALAAAFFGAGLLNFFFTPPYYTLAVATAANLVTLVAMLVVALLVALVVDRAARLAEQGARARTEAALLASYARTVLTSPFPLARLLEKVRENFALDSVALLERRDGEWERVACVGPRPCAEPDEADVDVPVTADVHLALRGRALPAADQRALEAAAGQALMALRQQRMAAETAEAQRRAETTELRTALLSAVGHDLRTPLTSIKAAIGSLRDVDLRLSDEDTAELLETVEVSADRLTGLIDNLLDSSRLATGAVVPQLRAVTYDEVVARALAGIDERRTVSVDVAEHLPPVLADLGLLERVVANVIDNALRHGRLSPRRLVDVDGDGRIKADEPEVAVRASAYRDRVELRVVDHGQGLPKNTASAVFAPFQRLGDRDATPGIGLGLSVAKGFVDAMGGAITAEDTPGGGLTIVISLPIAAVTTA